MVEQVGPAAPQSQGDEAASQVDREAAKPTANPLADMKGPQRAVHVSLGKLDLPEKVKQSINDAYRQVIPLGKGLGIIVRGHRGLMRVVAPESIADEGIVGNSERGKFPIAYNEYCTKEFKFLKNKPRRVDGDLALPRGKEDLAVLKIVRGLGNDSSQIVHGLRGVEMTRFLEQIPASARVFTIVNPASSLYDSQKSPEPIISIGNITAHAQESGVWETNLRLGSGEKGAGLYWYNAQHNRIELIGVNAGASRGTGGASTTQFVPLTHSLVENALLKGTLIPDNG